MRKTFVAAIVAAFMVVGLVAYATNVATDVPESHTFHDDITWMFENDISRGCNPPQGDMYCPEDFVTRGQMSAFFHRYHNMFGGGGDGQGPQGPPGADGADGQDGIDGQDGADGADGTDGVSGYELIVSPTMQFGDTGFAGWSCPAGKVVLGGGTDIPAQVSAPAGPGSIWPHYTFGADEYGWVVQKAATGAGAEGHVYVICATVGE